MAYKESELFSADIRLGPFLRNCVIIRSIFTTLISLQVFVIISILIIPLRSVASHVLALLAREGVQVTGLFLEAPFNNIADELSEHPLAQV